MAISRLLNNYHLFMKKYFLLLLLSPVVVKAQEILTLENAIGTALERSYDIKVAKMQQEVADIQVFKGNAGMMPKVDLNANMGTAFNEVNQKLSNGNETNRFGKSYTPTTNVAMTWTLYDGKKM